MRTVTMALVAALVGACSGRASMRPAAVHTPTDAARPVRPAVIEATRVEPPMTSVDPAIGGADDVAAASGELRGYAILAPRTSARRRTRTKPASPLLPLGCLLTGPSTSWYERYSRVKVDEVSVDGPLAAAVARRMLAAQVRLVKQCHALLIADDATAGGRVQARLVADSDGGTSDVALLAGDLTGLPFTACLVEALGAMKFPPADADTRVVVAYTLSARSQPPGDPACERLRQRAPWVPVDEPRRGEPGP